MRTVDANHVMGKFQGPHSRIIVALRRFLVGVSTIHSNLELVLTLINVKRSGSNSLQMRFTRSVLHC